MEIQLQNYYEDYEKTGWASYLCPSCGQWISYNTWHICYQYQWPSFYRPDKTEQAYAILKKLVEKKIVAEPKSYKEFCDLLDGIKEAL